MPSPSLTIKLKDPRKVKRFLTRLEKKQIPFATALAITKTLQRAKVGVIKQAKKDIDRPTPFTLRGFRVQSANKRTLTGRLFIAPIQENYLRYQIFGGVRRPKGTALALPPAKPEAGGVRLDRYGNVPRAQRARAQLGKGAFSGKVGNVAGIWKPPTRTKTGKIRKGSRMRLLLAYEQQAVYRPRYRFFQRAQGEINANFPREFDRAFRRATKTARR